MAIVNYTVSLSRELEQQTLSASQTTINLSTITVDDTGVNPPSLFIEGSFETSFTVTNATTIELSQSFPDGTQVTVLQYKNSGS